MLEVGVNLLEPPHTHTNTTTPSTPIPPLRQLFEHGYFGKGTVYRRVPVVAPVYPTAGSVAGAAVASKPRPARVVPTHVAPERRSGRNNRGAGTAPPQATTAETAPADLEDVDPSLAVTEGGADGAAAVPRPRPALSDHITLCAFEFERALANLPLPDAFLAAAGVAAHGSDPVRFESARQVAHYVSCPPGRDKAPTVGGAISAAPSQKPPSLSLAEGVSTPEAASAVAESTSADICAPLSEPLAPPEASVPLPEPSSAPAPPPLLVALPGVLRASESAILEPEAAMYLLDILGSVSRRGGGATIAPHHADPSLYRRRSTSSFTPARSHATLLSSGGRWTPPQRLSSSPRPSPPSSSGASSARARPISPPGLRSTATSGRRGG